MRKLFLTLLVIFSLFVISCKKENEVVRVVVPSGTPALGIATYIENNKDTVDIVEGPALQAAFTAASNDIIIAPTNMGAKYYNTNGSYLLYKVYVWGNLYVVWNKNKVTINSIADLAGKNITSFQKGSTPEIVLNAILNNNSINDTNVTYLNAVSDAVASFNSSVSDIIICAEPVLSKLRSKSNIGIIDLQDEWESMTNNSSYPQASIFVKASSKNKNSVKQVLNELVSSINVAMTDVDTTSQSAVNINSTFNTLGVNVLKTSIPNCHFNLLTNQQSAVEYYFNQMITLGFGAQIGGKLPDEEFYY